MSFWLETFVEEQYFPFYEFLWLCMIGLWWSVIVRLRRIEERLNKIKQGDNNENSTYR